MDSHYKSLAETSFESNILFIGQDSCPPNYFYRGNNVRDNYVIHYILSGKGTFSSANRPAITLTKGDIFLLPKGVPCFYQADGSDPWKYFWIGLSGIKIESMLAGSALLDRRYLRQVQHSQFFQELSALFTALQKQNSLANDIHIAALTYQMFYQLVTEFPNQTPKAGHKSRDQLQLATYYLQKNYQRPSCSVADLCHHLNLSRSYLYALFKKQLNMSAQGYLNRLRMERAGQLLHASNQSVQEIAHQVGYHDEFTFSKAFKRYSGFSPTVYRRNQSKNDQH